jgi:mono/diheme cytochrome c family protein
MSTQGLVLVILVPTAALLIVGLIIAIYTARGRAVASGIPPSRRAGPTDEALEGRTLERYQAWGLVLTAFLAVFLPFLYIREPARQEAASEAELAVSRERGEAAFQEFCATCHGPEATGGVVKRWRNPDDPEAEPVDFPAPDLTRIYERHQGQRVADVAWETIQQGRPGTPMPAWGVRFNGAMNDQQVLDLINWLITIQADGQPREPMDFNQEPGVEPGPPEPEAAG